MSMRLGRQDTIDTLFWKDFCDYYIEIAKERLYQPQKHGERQQHSGQIALYYSLLGILKLYAIYTPYVTEYIYQEFYRSYENEISLHLTQWETRQTKQCYIDFGEHLKSVIAAVRRDKTERQLSMKDAIPELIITCPKSSVIFTKRLKRLKSLHQRRADLITELMLHRVSPFDNTKRQCYDK